MSGNIDDVLKKRIIQKNNQKRKSRDQEHQQRFFVFIDHGVHVSTVLLAG
jgi:hypothetical protein